MLRTACASALDCELNGRCIRGNCVCDAAWRGAQCGELALLPGSRSQGYRPTIGGKRTGSWGGHAIRGDDGRYHIFASTLSRGCSIDEWYTNSFISHGVASSPLGPYAYSDTVRGVFSHGPVVAAYNGTLALVHVGCGEPQGGPEVNCRGVAAPAAPNSPPPCAVKEGTSYQLDGFDTLYTMPSALLGAATSPLWEDRGQVLWWPGSDPCNPRGNASAPSNRITNPSIHIFANGSALMAFRWQCDGDGDRPDPGSSPAAGRRIGLAYADDFRGPYRMRETPLRAAQVADEELEDPFLYADARGALHLLVHCTPYRGPPPAGHCHLFSADGGYTWHRSRGPPAATTEIEYEDGTRETVCRRERPQLLIEGGRPVALFSAVAPWGGGSGAGCVYNESYTYVQALAA